MLEKYTLLLVKYKLKIEMKKLLLVTSLSFSTLAHARGASFSEGSIILGLIGVCALFFIFMKLGKASSFKDSEAIFKGSAIFLLGLVVFAFLIKLFK